MSESTTCFGTVYKTTSKKENQGEGTAAEPRAVEELLQMLVEDRRSREAEFAEERRRRERELAAEWEAREREVSQQMETMRRQMESLMDLVKESKKEGIEVKPGSRIFSHNLQVKLVALSEKDDIEAYLVTFERIMEAYKVPKSEWTYHLALQLTGRAQQAFAALPGDNRGVYEELKATILLVCVCEHQ